MRSVISRDWAARACCGSRLATTEAEIAAAVVAVHQQHYVLNAQNRTAQRTSAAPLMLNSFAKSYIMNKAAEAALATPGVRGLVVTLGAEGCDVWIDGHKTHVPAVKPEAVVDPTGCGDAWRGALLFGLEQGWDLARCAALGNQIGALKIAQRGPQNYQIDLKALGL